MPGNPGFAPPPPIVPPSLRGGWFFFGASVLAAGTDFLFPAAGDSGTSNVAVRELLFPYEVTLRDFWAWNSLPTGAVVVTYDVTLAGVPQGLALAISSGGVGSASNLATVLTVAANTRIGVTAATAGVVGQAPRFGFFAERT